MNHLHPSRIRPDEFSQHNREKRDCVVIAISMLCSLPYKTALDILAAHGRKKNRGVRTQDVLKRQPTINGYTFKEVNYFERVTWVVKTLDGKPMKYLDRRWKTIGAFIKAHGQGRYLLQVSGHVITLIDGVMIDYTVKLNRRLRNAYLVSKED